MSTGHAKDFVKAFQDWKLCLENEMWLKNLSINFRDLTCGAPSQACSVHSSYSTLEPAGGFPQKLSSMLCRLSKQWHIIYIHFSWKAGKPCKQFQLRSIWTFPLQWILNIPRGVSYSTLHKSCWKPCASTWFIPVAPAVPGIPVSWRPSICPQYRALMALVWAHSAPLWEFQWFSWSKHFLDWRSRSSRRSRNSVQALLVERSLAKAWTIASSPHVIKSLKTLHMLAFWSW